MDVRSQGKLLGSGMNLLDRVHIGSYLGWFKAGCMAEVSWVYSGCRLQDGNPGEACDLYTTKTAMITADFSTILLTGAGG